MTRRQVLAIVAAGWALFVLGVAMLPIEWALPAALALAGLGMAAIAFLGLETET